MSRLFVRPDAPAVKDGDVSKFTAASWVLLDNVGEVRSQGTGSATPLADLAGAAALSEPSNIVLVLPAERCLSVQCVIPGRSTGQIRKALPFAVEEHLAVDLDSVHLASGPLRRQAPIDVVAIDRALLEGWVNALTAMGLTPGWAVADAALLSTGPNRIAVLFDGPRILVRTPRQWLGIEPDALRSMLTAAVGDVAVELELAVEAWNGVIDAITRAELEQTRSGRIDWQNRESDVPALVHLARSFDVGSAPVNLLVGALEPPRQRNEQWTRWRTAAVLAGVWLVLGLLATTTKGFWAEHRANVLASEADALYREYFPKDRRIQDVYRQTAAHLGASGSDSAGVLVMVGELAAVMTPQTGAQLRSLAFNSERLELNAELAVPGFERLDEVKTALTGRGLAVEISSAEQQDQGVLARLRIRGAS